MLPCPPADDPTPSDVPHITMVAIDVGGTSCKIAVGQHGEDFRRTAIRTADDDGRSRTLLRRIADAVDTLVDGGPRRPLVLAVAWAGIVENGSVDCAPNLPAIDGNRPGDGLATMLGAAAVDIQNDVHAATLAELRTGALVGCDPGIYLNVGTGLAANLVVGGTVVRGAHGAAGEIGYQRPLGRLGDRAFGLDADLERIAAGVGLHTRAGSLDVGPTTVELIANDDPVGQHLVHQAVGAIGTAVANLAAVVDPARIALGGGLAVAIPGLVQVVQAFLSEVVHRPPDVRLGVHGAHASLAGAIELAKDLADRTAQDDKGGLHHQLVADSPL